MAQVTGMETVSAGQLVTAVSVLGGVVSVLFWLLIASKDKLLAAKQAEFDVLLAAQKKLLNDVEGRQKSYEEMAEEAIKSALETANFYRTRAGLPPIIPVAPVIPESHSPPTYIQRQTARIATMRAIMADVKNQEGQEPRTESK